MPLFKGKSEKAFQHNVRAEMESGKPLKQSLAIAYSMKRNKKAYGGEAKESCPHCGKKMANCICDNMASGGSVESGDAEMNYAEGGRIGSGKSRYSTASGKSGFSRGGDISSETEPPGCPTCGAPRYSHGGQVANDEGQGVAADELPNEFDDLVLDDDQEMHGYTWKNSGDEIGGPSKDDVVSKAMIKRKKAKSKA